VNAERVYDVYCASPDCESHTEARPDGMVGRLFEVPVFELIDGEAWACTKCRTETSADDEQQQPDPFATE
jgi:hypothetical protein